TRAQRAAGVRQTQSYAGGDRSRESERLPSWSSFGHASFCTSAAAAPALAIDERPVFADEKFEVRALFVSELEKNPLAFRIVELVTVSLEETIRPAFTLDSNHQGLTVVNAVGKPIRRGGKEAV